MTQPSRASALPLGRWVSAMVLAGLLPVVCEAESISRSATLEEVPIKVTMQGLEKLLVHKSRLFLVDGGNHRIVTINGGTESSIGSLGNGEGEFYYPSDLAISTKDFLYIKDAGNHRIEILDPQGKYAGEFSDQPKSVGLAVTPAGDVLLGQPALGRLVTVYDSAGRRTRSFGDLIAPSVVYGAERRSFDDRYKIPMNRVRMALDDQGNTWLAFLHAPLIQKFDSKGNLVLTRTLQSAAIDALKRAVWQQPPPTEFSSVNIDGVQLTVVLKDIAVDPTKRELLVLRGDDRIVALDLDGQERYIIAPKLRAGTLQRLCVNASGEVFVSIFLLPKVFRLKF